MANESNYLNIIPDSGMVVTKSIPVPYAWIPVYDPHNSTTYVTQPTSNLVSAIPDSSLVVASVAGAGYLPTTVVQTNQDNTYLAGTTQDFSAATVKLPGGSANTVMCWGADGKTPGYATVAEITAGTCHTP